MSRKVWRRWDVAQLACGAYKYLANGMSRKKDVAQLEIVLMKCDSKRMSRKWDVAQIKCSADGCRVQ